METLPRIHSCLGGAFARLECTMALAALLDFMPPHYEVLDDGLTRVTDVNVTG
jgi:cytochrome P450